MDSGACGGAMSGSGMERGPARNRAGIRCRAVRTRLLHLGSHGRHVEVVAAGGDRGDGLRHLLVPHAVNGQLAIRVDDGAWTNVGVSIEGADNRLHRHLVVEAVQERVEIRGFDGRAPCVAPIAGINLYTNTAPDRRGTIVHNLGCNFDALLWFCRASAGDPLALLDDLRPDVVTVLFSNDVQYGVEQQYADAAPCADHKSAGLRRRSGHEPLRAERARSQLQARYRTLDRDIVETTGSRIPGPLHGVGRVELRRLACRRCVRADALPLPPVAKGYDDIAARVRAPAARGARAFTDRGANQPGLRVATIGR